ncbi:protein GREB1 isoform X1 [Alosa sapidissima]|uniref:protein GREB1 isoform X1 n=1 Tax=Alosa sapidissima TaxID=34773 RepID=UPI001C0A4CC0|nr:protein GREB1 isoform X1 [Alosa sapidissima]XP_041928754.1 protein GREB1 isoform X1 [Alosa sapidissima]
MGNSYAGQLRTTRFEEVLHSSIEASLRSNTVVPRPVFSQLYLEAENHPTSQNAGRTENEEDEEEDGSESNSPPILYQMKTPPEGSCTTDGFCQAGKDLRLGSMATDSLEVPPGFLLVGAKSPSIPDHILVCAVDRRFIPDERGHNALLGFAGNCMGCGEKGFRYFTEFSHHINLKLTTQPKKQKHLKHYLLRNAQGQLVKGPLICWKGIDNRVRQTGPVGFTGANGGEDHLNGPHPTETHTASGHSALSTANCTDPVGPLHLPENPHALTNGNHCPPSQQALQQPGVASHGRPSVIGTITNAGPPKKRHKGWSPESSKANDAAAKAVSTATTGPRSDNGVPVSVSQGSPPTLASGESVTVPENLVQTCKLQPVIFKGHGNLPVLCGNTAEVQVSALLQACYRNSQALPRVYEQYGAAPIQPLSTEMQILLTVYYLVQLGSHQMPLMEDLEQIFMRSWRESHLTEIRQYQQTRPQIPPQLPGLAQPLTPSQLPWLARLAASSCGDGVLVLDTAASLADGLRVTFQRLVDGKLAQTNYVVIICMGKSQDIESCVVVTGKHQTRALAESMLSPGDNLKAISYEVYSGMTTELRAYFNSLGPDGDMESLLEKASAESSGHFSLSSSQESVGDSPKPTCSEYHAEWHEIRAIQLAVARKLLSHVCAIADSSTQNLDLGSFDKVEFLICVPPSEVTFQQIILHLWNSGVLHELGLDQECLSLKQVEQYVVKLDQDAVEKIDSLIQKSKMNPYTLYILVHDHAHWDLSSAHYSGGGGSREGLVDSLLNCRQIRDAPNILTLHVTSFPFALQTQYTRVSPYNEIHWPSTFNNDVDLYNEKTKYFGISELLDSTHTGAGLPLLRFDSSFENMAAAVEDRFPKLHSAVIRTHILLQHYSVALMVASGQSHLQKHTSVETLEIVQCLLSSAQRCPSNHGHMVLLRVPSPALALVTQQRLTHVRDKLGLQNQFEVVLGNPTSALSLGKHFLDQLKVWLKVQDPDWTPRTYLELEALPCILILTGMEPLGESLPRSLKYCDLRVISSAFLQRTPLEQELGLAAYLVKAGARDPHDPRDPRAATTGSDLSESDPEKLCSTDNEEEEVVVDVNSDLPGLDPSPPPASQHSQSDGSILDPEKPQPPPQLPPDPRDPTRAAPAATTDPSTAQRRPSKSTSSGSSSTRASTLRQRCSWARNRSRPPVVLLPRAAYEVLTALDASGLPKSTSLLPHAAVEWASSFRPLLSKIMTCTEQSLYYRQWTVPRPNHMDSSNRAEGRADNFHPRRLLLSGPPQVGKTGAYLQFLGILSRMLIRLMQVDIYDEEDINCSDKLPLVQYHQAGVTWPSTDILRSMSFDYTIHDPKYEGISLIYSTEHTPAEEGNPRRQEDVYLRRRTSRIKLSKYAAYNTYHHCEQCHQYMGFNPRYQLYESTLHTFTFSHLLLGEEIQLYFIIPKSKEHHFAFSQPGGQLESLRLPLASDWNPDCIKSPIFTPTTGRHEHGLFNLYHAMDGAAHLHILVIKEYEMAVYKKYWPNHIMLVLPTTFNGAGIGAAHFLIKELSYHNLELERSRRVEHGSRAQDVWPFIILADDSCVMWNALDVDPKSGSKGTERNVSLKQVLQHMESSADITQYGLCGLRKWSSRYGNQTGRHREPFSRGHLHDFLLLNVDLTQNVQYNQNRFTCDDVDFNLRAHSAGLLVCRFNNFSVMKKQITIGGYRTFIVKTKMTDVPTTVQPSQYICAPDSKHTFLSTPAQLLLEKYLQHTSHKLFPLSAHCYSHPVLSVDCYLNLGPEVTVCFVSSRPHSINLSTTDLLFGGLLLYFCDSFVTPGFLKKFHFLQGATLCVICPNRSSLRQTVVRLELEDEWRFRLSDEFQTANAKEDQPLFFLTGKHI